MEMNRCREVRRDYPRCRRALAGPSVAQTTWTCRPLREGNFPQNSLQFAVRGQGHQRPLKIRSTPGSHQIRYQEIRAPGQRALARSASLTPTTARLGCTRCVSHRRLCRARISPCTEAALEKRLASEGLSCSICAWRRRACTLEGIKSVDALRCSSSHLNAATSRLSAREGGADAYRGPHPDRVRPGRVRP